MIAVWREAANGRTGKVEAAPANPTLIDCTFHGNSASRKGGGVYNSGGSPNFVSCTFRGNHALGSADIPDGGGGMYNLNGSATVRDCTFRRNTTGGRGAGMYNSGGSQTIIRCLFKENEAFISYSDDTRVGGGILSLGSTTVIRECVFAENSAANGGGVFTVVPAQPLSTASSSRTMQSNPIPFTIVKETGAPCRTTAPT
jgi:hypothetical protein